MPKKIQKTSPQAVNAVNADFLSSDAELFNVFAPVKGIKLKSAEKGKKFFEQYGGEFPWSQKDLNYILFYYLGMAGYVEQYDVFWAIITITPMDYLGEIKPQCLLHVSRNDQDIDYFLTCFFDYFSAKRISAPLQEPSGPINELLESCNIWYDQFFPFYREEAEYLLAPNPLRFKELDVRKKLKSRQKKKPIENKKTTPDEKSID